MRGSSLLFLLLVPLLAAGQHNGTKPRLDPGRAALDENFGYVEVRPGAKMFWVMYHTELPGDFATQPLIMWLQGGPGASGVGYGNFEELGPYDKNGNLRDGRWTKKANLMFVDNPVGSGYSYVDNLNLLTTTNLEIADDLVALVKGAFTAVPEMQTMPFYVFCESYGGKMTADFAVAFDKAIKNGEVVSDFRGVGLGDGWVHPMDSVNTWGQFLYQMGFVNRKGLDRIEVSAAKTQAAVDAGQWVEATNLWSNTEIVVAAVTYGVNFYNVLAKEDIYRARELSSTTTPLQQLYDHHVAPFQSRDALGDFMNGPSQKTRWNIPDNVTWGSQSNAVFNALAGDFMKPVVDSVVTLLTTTNLHVSVYTGDLDLICDTPGTYKWIEDMQWPDKLNFDSSARTPIYITAYSNVAAYVQRYNQLSLITVLRSGHMVPLDAPETSLQMIDLIFSYAAKKTATPHQDETVLEEEEPKPRLAKVASPALPKVASAALPEVAQVAHKATNLRRLEVVKSRPHPATPNGKRFRVNPPIF